MKKLSGSAGFFRFSANRFKPAKYTVFLFFENRVLVHACWVSKNRFKTVFFVNGAHL